MTGNTAPLPTDLQNYRQETVHWPGKAYRVVLVDSDGNEITSAVPLPTKQVPLTDLECLGKVDVGTTAVKVEFTGTTRTITISADLDNTGIIYVGKSTVTSAGAYSLVALLPGQGVELDYDDATNDLYVVGSAASQKVILGAGL